MQRAYIFMTCDCGEGGQHGSDTRAMARVFNSAAYVRLYAAAGGTHFGDLSRVVLSLRRGCSHEMRSIELALAVAGGRGVTTRYRLMIDDLRGVFCHLQAGKTVS